MNQMYRLLRSIIDVILFVIELFLGLRLLLRLFGANPDAGFVAWIYKTSEPLLAPFLGMFPSPVIDGQFVLEFNTLIAMIVYALAGYLLQQLLYHIHRSTMPPAERKETKEVHHYHD